MRPPVPRLLRARQTAPIGLPAFRTRPSGAALPLRPASPRASPSPRIVRALVPVVPSCDLAAVGLAHQKATPAGLPAVAYPGRRPARACGSPTTLGRATPAAAAETLTAATALAPLPQRRRARWPVGPAVRASLPIMVIGRPVLVALKAHVPRTELPLPAPAQTPTPLALQRLGKAKRPYRVNLKLSAIR